MRQFVVVGHDAPTTPDFSLDDLAGGAGRLDLLARSVGSALFLSHGVRRDTRVSLVLRDELTVTFDGSDVRNAHPDERNLAGLLRNALEARDELIGQMPVTASPGVELTRRDLEATIRDAARRGTIVQLHEDGDPVADIEPPTDPLFVLSDHRDFTDDEESLLSEVADHRVRLGPEAIHADHAITVAHNYLDTDGYTSY
jgi:tRNA (pseudouridine54-N1)-methyltransferase